LRIYFLGEKLVEAASLKIKGITFIFWSQRLVLMPEFDDFLATT